MEQICRHLPLKTVTGRRALHYNTLCDGTKACLGLDRTLSLKDIFEVEAYFRHLKIRQPKCCFQRRL